MDAPWTPEHVVDAGAAAALIADQIPALAGAGVVPMGEGHDNTAHLVGDVWVFRFPRRAIAVPLIEREAALLPWVAPRVPLPVPVPEHLGRPSAAYPWPFSGYRRLPGRTVCALALDEAQRTSLAEPLGRFLAALHALPAREAEARGAEGDTIGRMDFARRTPRTHARLEEIRRAGVIDPSDVDRLSELFAHPPEPSGAPVLVHGDLYARHLLADEGGRLAGVIDWGDVHVGERAADLALAHAFLPPGARPAFLRAYGPVDAATWARAAARAVQHSALIGRYALEVRDDDLLREAALALRWAGRDPGPGAG